MVTFGLNWTSVLAQVNFGTNSASILGIFLAVAGAALYFLRTVRPELSRDQDIFFAAVGLLCGFILVFQGWRLDPILQFGQLLLVGSTVFFAIESIRLRSIATKQAREKTPIEDYERPVSNRPRYEKRYNAEVDADLEPLPYYEDDEDLPPRRISASRDSRSSRDDYYSDEAPRRSVRNGSERPETGEKPRRRGSSRPASRTPEKFEEDNWGSSRSSSVDDWDSSTSEERRPPRRSGNSPSRPEIRDEEVTSRPPRRRRPPTEASRPPRDDDAMSVDYKPIDQTDDESDNSANFDDNL